MFCPKCGKKNPDDGKFCRACGTDLGNVSAALSGKMPQMQSVPLLDKKGKPVRWESVLSTTFTGLAFLIVAIFLGFSGSGNGWWFWMLIPAFAMLGTGIAQLIQLRANERSNAAMASAPGAKNTVGPAQDHAELPASRTEYVAPESRFKTGDLVPSSVTERTTNLLKHDTDSEGETRALPNDRL